MQLNAPKRLAALDRSGVMLSRDDPAFTRAVHFATRLLHTPVSLVSFVDSERQFFAAQAGLTGWAAEEKGTPLSHSFCQHVVISGQPLVIDDARAHPLVAANPAIRDLNVVAYLGIPIRSPGGHVLGSFCAIDREPRAWTAEDIAAMTDIAAGLESELKLREVIQDREIILQEMNHRVKNLFTLVGSIVRMESRTHDTVPEFTKSVTARIRALNEAHALVVPIAAAEDWEGSKTTLEALLSKLLAPHSTASGSEIEISGQQVSIGPRAAVHLTLALHELGTNAAKYGVLGRSDGHLSVSWRVEDETALVIDWTETGGSWDPTDDGQAGFGSTLIALSIERQLQGSIEKAIDTDSFAYRLRIPLVELES